MYSDGDLPKDFKKGAQLTGGPGVELVWDAGMTGKELTYYTEDRPEGIRAIVWGVRCLDSARLNLQVKAEIVVGDGETIPAEIRQWHRRGAIGGYLKAASED